MFRETEQGETQYCPMCEEWAEKYERLQSENEELKKENEEINRRMSDVIYRATGGRLCYSTYTLHAIEQAFQDQLEILSDRKAEELEQELEELRIKYAGCKTANTAIQQENEELKAENERLKKRQITKNGFICDCEQNVKYRQALEEIKEMCKRQDFNQGMRTFEILKKVDEVLDENSLV